MRSLLDITLGYLTDDGWSPEVLEDEDGIVAAGYQGDNGAWSCYAVALEDEERVVFYSVYPDDIAEPARPAVAELFTLVNYALLVGNLEIDLFDGEARCRTSVDVEGSEMTAPLLRQLVEANVATMDLVFPAIAAVASGERSARDAWAALGG